MGIFDWFWSNDRCEKQCTDPDKFGFISSQTCDDKYKGYILQATCDDKYKTYILPENCPATPATPATTVEPFQYNPFITKKW
jgi:hypothetical protein